MKTVNRGLAWWGCGSKASLTEVIRVYDEISDMIV